MAEIYLFQEKMELPFQKETIFHFLSYIIKGSIIEWSVKQIYVINKPTFSLTATFTEAEKVENYPEVVR